MVNEPRWSVGVVNNCLFVNEKESGRNALQHNARPGLRPYIHPLRGPDGQACLTEDSPWHHPWQHGVQTGYHGVNGCDFWFDPGQRPGVIGTIEPKTPRILSDDPPRWSIEAVWRHEDGTDLLAETQTWLLTPTDDVLYLDFDWVTRAIPDVNIEQGAYGGFFVRMPFRSDRAAAVVNSEGQKEDETEQQPAAWVHLTMQVNRGDVTAGIAILDHPGNPRHPAHWRVDGQRGINPAPCIPGSIDLSAGETMTHRYRLVLHTGEMDSKTVQQHWDTYAND